MAFGCGGLAGTMGRAEGTVVSHAAREEHAD